MKSRELHNEEYAKTVQLGNATRDYLVLYGKILDCREQLEKLLIRDYGEMVADRLTKPIYEKYIDPLLNELKDDFANQMILNLMDYTKQEL